MAKHNVTFDVENSKSTKQQYEHETNEGYYGAHKELPINPKFLDVRGLTFLVTWKKIFVISCAFGVSVDPLFFYIPFVNKNMKCFELDKKLKTIALVSRLLTDFMYVIDIILQIWIVILAKRRILVSNPLAMLGKWAWKSYIIMDILAILPAPQVLTFILFPKTRGSSSLLAKEFMTTFALLQYVPRVFRIYVACKEFNKTPTTETRIWIFFKGGFSLFLYILTSHVLGAFWYFLAMQRESTCWQLACQSDQNGCKRSTFYCNDRLFQNLTTLNDLCPINPSDAKVFDFGIFLDALQSGVVESTDFPRKILHCFWWGLRNLSSLGSNLETSNYAMENLFAVFISLFALVLFIFYLSGTLQQIWTHRVTKSSAKRKVLRQMELKKLEIHRWLSENGIGIPKHLKKVMIQRLQIHLEGEENIDVNMKSIISIVSVEDRRLIKLYLSWSILKKVPMFQTLDEKVLKEISQSLQPVMFTEDTYIVKEGKPLDKMLFVTQGIVWSYGSSNNNGSTRCLKKGDFYGEELLNWVSEVSYLTTLPISTRFVKSHTYVEAFVLRAYDLKTIVSKNWLHFFKFTPPSQKQHLAASSLQESWRRHLEKKARAVHLAQLREMGNKKITDEVPRLGQFK
ncbi:hypothetical protein ACFX13_037386 [Malus domestica]|uniref:cyclic nucleotide-gated ion channel 1-like isoform X1 n=2 Tax=Malus domestica TaxID=3750 RepID=UPI0010AAB01E|nr:cyclic nucleotide-gated ion channel 1-like [Malus domestica]